ncbi:MAG: hypothetical protein ACK5XN_09205, partial [Bacteroidota bacterium]
VNCSIPGHCKGAKLLQGGKRKESITENQTNRINYRLRASFLLDIRPDATAVTSREKSHQNAISLDWFHETTYLASKITL